MSERRRTILGLGMLAALLQLLVWPPHLVPVSGFTNDYRGVVIRRFPFWKQPETLLDATTDERLEGAPEFLVHAGGGDVLDTGALAVQLGATLLLTGLLLLLGRPKPAP